VPPANPTVAVPVALYRRGETTPVHDRHSNALASTESGDLTQAAQRRFSA
jgi:hypothetical protein